MIRVMPPGAVQTLQILCLISEESGIGLVELGELEAETSFISSQESHVKWQIMWKLIRSDRCEQRPPEVGVTVIERHLELLLLPHLVVELKDELPEDEGAHVIGQDMQKSPVSEFEPVRDVIQNVADPILKDRKVIAITRRRKFLNFLTTQKLLILWVPKKVTKIYILLFFIRWFFKTPLIVINVG